MITPQDNGLSFDPDLGFGIYVHWPFCAAKCPYCDFNSHVRHVGVNAESFGQALVTELAHAASQTRGRTVQSVFFGGGTPSLMPAGVVGAILDEIANLWTVDPHAEITLEANPTSVEADRFRGYHSAGVNRVSLGVQSLRDDELKALGRLHTASEAIAAVELAQSIFSRTSFDLIYARPGQSMKAWEEELREGLDRAGEHLSLYQLTIEPDTAFAALYDAGKLQVPGADDARALYDLTQAMTLDAGLPAYEISNHARPGAESRHNLIYWRCGDYVGVGPGAHGRLTVNGNRLATNTERMPETWRDLVETNGHGLIETEALDRIEVADELLVMGLRLTEGIDPARYEMLSGRKLARSRVDDLVTHGMVQQLDGGRLAVTMEGFPVLNAVVADLAADPFEHMAHRPTGIQ